ncbi:MAG: TetR/AcrR family transcriptional regulator C-terminal domain-containing protein [Bdellovibrionaceae bacterium]|nr:TetR/AcrR family transcriptional regulator C-terminal domain-containing protein [Pseudobdellovibrionaceae bacterium]
MINYNLSLIDWVGNGIVMNMAKLVHDAIIDAALELLNEGGLEYVTTRRLATRLGVESASLYWHIKNKAELFQKMSAEILKRHHKDLVPTPSEDWKEWLIANFRSLRSVLLTHRDGAKLHAGSMPAGDTIDRHLEKLNFLVQVGFQEKDAMLALFCMGQYTVGCVLEEQSLLRSKVESKMKSNVKINVKSNKTNRKNASPKKMMKQAGLEFVINPEESFEFGLRLLVNGFGEKLS